LIVAGEYPSPVGIADVITTTTHKTLRGPRGGIIMTNNQEIAKKINFAVFPFSSGGPLEHVIAAKAIAFMEAQTQEFKQYAKQIKKNIQAMISVFKKNGFKIVSNGSDSHMFLLDLTPFKISGKKTADMLDLCGITLNMNLIPNDPLSPKKTSGVRIGTPAITTRGFKEEECFEIANIISDIVNFIKDKKDEELNNNKL
jgi:glycine hydroxymethyltransferase